MLIGQGCKRGKTPGTQVQHKLPPADEMAEICHHSAIRYSKVTRVARGFAPLTQGSGHLALRGCGNVSAPAREIEVGNLDKSLVLLGMLSVGHLENLGFQWCRRSDLNPRAY